jgi:peptidoglycan lytic transglycosylase A
MIRPPSGTLLVALALLAGCAGAPGPVAGDRCPCGRAAPQPPPPRVETFQQVAFSDIPGWSDGDQAAAWSALLASCQALRFRETWRAACQDAAALQARDDEAVRRFLEARFVPWRLANPDGRAEGLVTGYYEPLLRGSRVRQPPFVYPLYAPPDDLLTIDLSAVNPDLRNMRLRGRLQGRKVVPYYSRAEIDRGAAPVAGKELVWVDDAVEAFFLQIQGSGRVRLANGDVLRLGYADQNGHPYQSIGRYLVERGELQPGEASMQAIHAWAGSHPDRLGELLSQNPSYVFFRELPLTDPSAGPIGAFGVPLTPQRSIAVDPRYVPLGAPVFLATTWPSSDLPLNRLVIAQDTGGAIRGPVRADYFWGFGPEAGALAGRMRQQGAVWLLLPAGMPPPAS